MIAGLVYCCKSLVSVSSIFVSRYPCYSVDIWSFVFRKIIWTYAYTVYLHIGDWCVFSYFRLGSSVIIGAIITCAVYQSIVTILPSALT